MIKFCKNDLYYEATLKPEKFSSLLGSTDFDDGWSYFLDPTINDQWSLNGKSLLKSFVQRNPITREVIKRYLRINPFFPFSNECSEYVPTLGNGSVVRKFVDSRVQDALNNLNNSSLIYTTYHPKCLEHDLIFLSRLVNDSSISLCKIIYRMIELPESYFVMIKEEIYNDSRGLDDLDFKSNIEFNLFKLKLLVMIRWMKHLGIELTIRLYESYEDIVHEMTTSIGEYSDISINLNLTDHNHNPIFFPCALATTRTDGYLVNFVSEPEPYSVYEFKIIQNSDPTKYLNHYISCLKKAYNIEQRLKSETIQICPNDNICILNDSNVIIQDNRTYRLSGKDGLISIYRTDKGIKMIYKIKHLKKKWMNKIIGSNSLIESTGYEYGYYYIYWKVICEKICSLVSFSRCSY